MRLPLIFLIVVCTLCLLTDWRIDYVIRHRCGKRVATVYRLLTTVLCWGALIVALCLPRRDGDDTTLRTVMWLLFTFGSIYAAKLVFVIIDALACLPRLWHHRRCRRVTYVGIGIAVLLFGATWWGALINRFRIDVRNIDVNVQNLPPAFEGYRIVQFSDIHVGTYGADTTYISRVVDCINTLKPDAVMFTGDIVNRRSEELAPFMTVLSRINAPDGVISVLGNHDYGDYADWPDETTKMADRRRLQEMQRLMGWNLLLDDHTFLRRGTDSIAVIGVENIGDPPFPSYGSLPRATEGISPETPKILMSHNPAHWADSLNTVSRDQQPIDLTLSGHTHAMQIEVAGLSPAALRYPYWGGLYGSADERYLYVNIGIGTVGLPMRLGATPEITLITLHRAKP